MKLRQREAIEAIALSVVGAIGVVVGARGFAPAPVVAQPAPTIAPPEGGWPAMERPAHVGDYAISASLDPSEHTVDGKETITFHNSSNATLDHLRLHLYLNAFKNDETVFRRAHVGGFFRGTQVGDFGFIDVASLTVDGEDLWPKHAFVNHLGDTPQDPLRKGMPFPVEGAPDDETDVEIPLGAHTIAPGGTATITVDFHEKLPEVSERTGYMGSFHFVGQWFPKLAKLEDDGTWAGFAFHHTAEFYADYGAWDVTLDVPKAFVVAACGEKVDSHEEGERRVDHYQLTDAHDFSWTAWDQFHVVEATEGGVALHGYFPPGYDDAMAREIESVRQGLRDLGARFGEYPYRDLTIVHPPEDAGEAGGMEYPTLITTGGPWYPNHGTHEVEGVTVHELGHQWFYGLIGTHEVEWPSGDEGFNSWAEQLDMERMFGNGTAVSINAFQISYLTFSRRGSDPSFDEAVFQPAYDFATGRNYGARVYGATAVIMETLRRSFGPERFDQAMGVYARKFRWKHPRPNDFFATLDDECGKDCGAAARVAFLTPEALDLYVEPFESTRDAPPTGSFDVDGTRRELRDDGDSARGYSSLVWIGRRGALIDLPVDVELRFADGSRRIERVHFGAPDANAPPRNDTWARLDVESPSQLLAVIVDPELKVPMDRTRLDNFATLPSAHGGAPVTRERAFDWIGVLAREVGP